jgi:hypothetical protein
MALSTYIEATIERFCSHGTVDTVRVSTTGKTSVVWRSGTREVWIGESNLLGRKLALYEALRNPATIAKIKRLEAEAKQRADLLAIAQDDDETALLLGIDREDDFEAEPVHIESDPYIALGV